MAIFNWYGALLEKLIKSATKQAIPIISHTQAIVLDSTLKSEKYSKYY